MEVRQGEGEGILMYREREDGMRKAIQMKETHVNWTTMPSLTPSAMAWAMPNLGTFLAHSGLKWSVRQIFPPLQQEDVVTQSFGGFLVPFTHTWTSWPSYHRVQVWLFPEQSLGMWQAS